MNAPTRAGNHEDRYALDVGNPEEVQKPNTDDLGGVKHVSDWKSADISAGFLG